jgi:hypothetical protein
MTDGWWTPRGRREEKKWQHEMKPLDKLINLGMDQYLLIPFLGG